MNLDTLEALAYGDRAAALAALVPGTVDHDRFRVLHHQQRGELDAARDVLDGWVRRHGRHDPYRTLWRRQLVLEADRDLARGGRALADELGIGFEHGREVPHAPAEHPTSWRLPGTDAILAEGAGREAGLSRLTDLGVRALGFAGHRRSVLSRLARGGVPGLVDALVAEFTERDGVSFGGLAIHRALTLAELDALGARVDWVNTDREFVLARITRHRPPAHVDLDERSARAAWLEVLWGLVRELPGVFSDLKLHVLGHWLLLDRQRDLTDAGRVLAYTALPRRASYVRADWLSDHDSRHVGGFGVDFSRATGLAALGDDTELVRHHVARLIGSGTPIATFEATIDREWLRTLEAEVHLLAGDEDDSWSRRLGTTAALALRDRVDVELCAHNAPAFPRDGEVWLDVDVKNAWPLRVRVYRIDVAAAFAAGRIAIGADLDLDGIVARDERVVASTDGAMKRSRQRIALPEVDRPGTWIVELVGGGRASRALVQKGDLRAVARVTAAGVELTVLDAAGEHRPDASARLGTADHAPRDGVVVLPFGSQGQAVLLVDGDLAVPISVQLVHETPSLTLSVALDPQALVPGTTATALVRPVLRLAGAPATLELVEEAWVEVSTTDRTGVPASRRQPVALTDDAELAVPIAVPEHLASLSIAVGGRIRVISQQRHEALRAEVAVAVGHAHDSAATYAVYRIPTPDGETLRLLGKNGEPVAGRAITVEIGHELVHDSFVATLATDATGTIDLGPLPGATHVTAMLAHGLTTFDLRPLPLPTAPRVVPRGEPVRIPWRGRWRLLELRGDAPAHDRSDHGVEWDELLEFPSLPAGTYRLEGDPGVLTLVVLPAERPPTDVIGTPTGTFHLAPAPTVLARAAVEGRELVIEVSDATADTRVHVIATPTAPSGGAELAGAERAGVAVGWRGNRAVYVSGRDLGDEIRYVLERRTQPRRPGTLLDKPTLILNPWSLRTTSTRVQTARSGGNWNAPAPAPPPPGAPPAGYAGLGSAAFGAARAATADVADELSRSGSGLAEPFWDFLATPARVHANLRPDPHGRIRVPLGDLPGAVAEVICVDPTHASRRRVVLPAGKLATRDRRLAASLPADRHFAERRTLSAKAGPRSVAVDRLEPLYRALVGLSGDPTLVSWDFLARWPTLSRDEKLRRWHEHACHELALFVAHRDRALWDDALAQFVADKLEPTFVDDLLVGRDLGRWLVPWRFASLDVVERALLARARPDLRERIARGLADEVELRRPDRQRDDRLVDALLGGSGESPAPPPDLQAVGGGGAGRGGAPAMPAAAAPMPPSETDSLDDERPSRQERARRAAPSPKMKKEAAARPMQQELWRAADLTREWAEHGWHQVRLAQNGPGRIAASRLWRDYARHGDGPFLPASLADAADSFSTAVCALAVIGVEPATIHAEAALLPADAPDGTVLAGQHTVRADDRYVWDGDEQREKHVGDELLVRVVYTTVVAVTNPTARHRRLGVLVQIPAGAIPVSGGLATRTTAIDLPAYATTTLEVSFYFPQEGAFSQYGARIAEGDRVVGAAADRSFRVLRVPSAEDAESWAWLSQEAPLPTLLSALGRLNLRRLDLARLGWRMRERPAFEAITAALAARDAWDATLWGYALLHADRARAGELLDRTDAVVQQVGPLRCGLVTVDPVDRRQAEHLEYAPLVNARAHRLGADRTVLNDGLAGHWQALLDRLATAPTPTRAELLQVVQELFTMDRPDEAMALLATLHPAGGPRLQDALLRAYAATLAGELDTATLLVAPYVEHPVPRWRARFQAIRAMIDEVRGAGISAAANPDSRDARMAELAARQPALTARIADGALVIESVNLATASVRVHPMDVELLFSREPFLSTSGDRFAVVEPREIWPIELDPSGRTVRPLPAALARSNVAFEVRSGALRQVVTHLAHDLAVTVSAGYGQLQVRRASTGEPLAAAYVKAFGRQRGGVPFYKDGYTDLRGRFDYATLSTDDLDRTERFALLVVHDDAGATILEAAPPTR